MQKDDYNPTGHTLTILMVLAVCLAVILMLLCSCKATHEVEYVYSHDTLHVWHTDTLIDSKVLTVHDTTTHIEHHYIVQNEQGEPIREYHYTHERIKTELTDSTKQYKAKNDSLQKLLNQERNKEKVVEKKEPWWKRLKGSVTDFLAFCGLIVLSFVSYKVARRYWQRRK